MTCMQGIMGKFKKNTAMMTNQGIDVVVNKTEEPLLKLKKRAKPLKVSSNETATVLLKVIQICWHPIRQHGFCAQQTRWQGEERS